MALRCGRVFLVGVRVGATSRRWAAAAAAATTAVPHKSWQAVVQRGLAEAHWEEHYGTSDTGLDHELETRLLTQAFEEYDLNKNGVLERNEVQAALRDLGLDDSEAAIDAIFAVYDTNRDGVLQLDEWLNQTDQPFRDAVLNAFFKHCD